jgi:UDP-N-acetylglucosamine--N-acetylmuramyl-(pentapeptide) pyrophosphoryl-undecaprenol N-acetylglucosamine transferase
VFPGLATARALQARGHDVTLWLAGKSIETATRHAWTGPVVSIPSGGLSISPLRLPFTIVTLIRVYRASLRALRQHRPQALLAMGSYSSLGPVLAARRLGIPVVLHEANVIPGRAIDFLSRFAHTVAVNFPETRDYLPRVRMAVTGIPLRKELESAAAVSRVAPERFTVLVMGGSQGAHRVNELAVEALCRLHREGIPLGVVHLSGEKDKLTVSAAYQTAGIPHTVHGFLRDMATAYAGTSLAIARSGANSCMELALFGVPALLIPYPLAARNHQVANARAMALAGAAEVIEQKDLTVDSLAAYIRDRINNAPALDSMRLAARRRAMTGADEKLADLVEEVAAGR